MNGLLALMLAFQSAPEDPYHLNLNQRLILACHQVRLDDVVRCIREGADVNAVFGDHDESERIFLDPWDGGFPFVTHEWTPLLALAASSKYPPPPRNLKVAADDWPELERLRGRLANDVIQERQGMAMAILFVLLSHDCDLDHEDGVGATALAFAVDEDKLLMVKTLLEYGADPNTKTGVYIDGPGDTTPLHNACNSREIMQLLLDHGADPRAVDSNGKTPADWVALGSHRDFDLIITDQGAKLVDRPAKKSN